MFKGKRVVFTGGSGVLGKELAPLIKKAGATIICPSHKEMPVEDIVAVHEYVKDFLPDIIVHAAAFTDVPKSELPRYRRKAVETNIYGSDNVKYAADSVGAKVVYISTDYVYSGRDGDYAVSDPTSPKTFYGFTKLVGESSMAKTDLIIRTSFLKRGTWGPAKKQLSGVFKDIYTSKDWVDVIAGLIFDNLNRKGIINIGTERKSLESLARQECKDVDLIDSKDFSLGYEYPADMSMKLSI